MTRSRSSEDGLRWPDWLGRKVAVGAAQDNGRVSYHYSWLYHVASAPFFLDDRHSCCSQVAYLLY
jgi:hypothetical protein